MGKVQELSCSVVRAAYIRHQGSLLTGSASVWTPSAPAINPRGSHGVGVDVAKRNDTDDSKGSVFTMLFGF